MPSANCIEAWLLSSPAHQRINSYGLLTGRIEARLPSSPVHQIINSYGLLTGRIEAFIIVQFPFNYDLARSAAGMLDLLNLIWIIWNFLAIFWFQLVC